MMELLQHDRQVPRAEMLQDVRLLRQSLASVVDTYMSRRGCSHVIDAGNRLDRKLHLIGDELCGVGLREAWLQLDTMPGRIITAARETPPTVEDYQLIFDAVSALSVGIYCMRLNEGLPKTTTAFKHQRRAVQDVSTLQKLIDARFRDEWPGMVMPHACPLTKDNWRAPLDRIVGE